MDQTTSCIVIASLIAALKSRSGLKIAIAIIGARIGAMYMIPDDHLKPWMGFITISIDFAVCTILLETSTLFMPPPVRSAFYIDTFSDLMACLAIYVGVLGFLIHSTQHAMELDTAAALIEMSGVMFVSIVFLGTVVVILFGEKLIPKKV